MHSFCTRCSEKSVCISVHNRRPSIRLDNTWYGPSTVNRDPSRQGSKLDLIRTTKYKERQANRSMPLSYRAVIYNADGRLSLYVCKRQLSLDSELERTRVKDGKVST